MIHQGDVTGSAQRQQVDVWHVRLASGETRTLSLDELDAAFHEGWIDGRTLVLPAGALRWAPLSEVAGLDETPPPVEATPPSIAPLAFDTAGLDSEASESLDSLSDEELHAFRPRRGKKIFGVMTVLLVIAGVGFAGVRARPAIARAVAARGGSAAAKLDAPKPARPAETSPPAVTPTPPPAAIPTMLASALPDASAPPSAEADKKAAADARKGKPVRPAPKRATK